MKKIKVLILSGLVEELKEAFGEEKENIEVKYFNVIKALEDLHWSMEKNRKEDEAYWASIPPKKRFCHIAKLKNKEETTSLYISSETICQSLFAIKPEYCLLDFYLEPSAIPELHADLLYRHIILKYQQKISEYNRGLIPHHCHTIFKSLFGIENCPAILQNLIIMDPVINTKKDVGISSYKLEFDLFLSEIISRKVLVH